MEHNLPENTSNNIYGSIVIYLLTFKETVYTESFLM